MPRLPTPQPQDSSLRTCTPLHKHLFSLPLSGNHRSALKFSGSGQFLSPPSPRPTQPLSFAISQKELHIYHILNDGDDEVRLFLLAPKFPLVFFLKVWRGMRAAPPGKKKKKEKRERWEESMLELDHYHYN